MDLRSAAQSIRDTVSMNQILDLYGYTTKHGFMVCPFHGDHDASLRVYDGDRGWYCFGCHRHGSVIDFVMEHENCNFQTAVRAIDNALHLDLFQANENPYDAEANREFQLYLDGFVQSIYDFCEARDRTICAILYDNTKRMKDIRDKCALERTKEEETFLLTFDDECQYQEYLIEKINEFREEVAAWRRKARRIRI